MKKYSLEIRICGCTIQKTFMSVIFINQSHIMKNAVKWKNVIEYSFSIQKWIELVWTVPTSIILLAWAID